MPLTQMAGVGACLADDRYGAKKSRSIERLFYENF